MKLLTLNCHAWQESDTLQKIEYIAEIIAQNDIDIIGLQEASQSKTSDILILKSELITCLKHPLKIDNYAYLLQKALDQKGLSYYLTWDMTHFSYEHYEEGVAILSRYPFTETSSFWIGTARDYHDTHSRKAIKASIVYQNQILDIYSIHAGWWHDARSPAKAQFDDLITQICPHKISFLLGDFNNSATVRSEGYDYLTLTHGLIDTYNLAEKKDDGFSVIDAIAGWQDNQSKLRIDLILSSNNIAEKIKVDCSQILFNGQQTAQVSDHFAVFASITFHP